MSEREKSNWPVSLSVVSLMLAIAVVFMFLIDTLKLALSRPAHRNMRNKAAPPTPALEHQIA